MLEYSAINPLINSIINDIVSNMSDNKRFNIKTIDRINKGHPLNSIIDFIPDAIRKIL